MCMMKTALTCLLTGAVMLPALAADNMKFHGALVAEPCVLQPGDEDIQLDFGSIVDKYLYSHQRTQSKAFQLRLAECDISLGNLVKVSFGGQHSSALPGLLAVEVGGQNAGVAIGIETPGGQPIALNQPGQRYSLNAGGNIINLQAYVQGEPQAIANRSIVYGAFTSAATFTLEYE
ncbi:TPA: fimbrial protein [Serratia marcescens]